MEQTETIFAEATSPGRAGVSIVRISGPSALAVAERLCGKLPLDGRGLRKLGSASGSILDEALILTFARGQSFTGEFVVELHLHGSRAVVAAVLGELDGAPEARRAEAGEFTRRALDNGRLDLAQVEGLADLIDAETEMQRRQAMRVFSGAIGDRVEAWRADLLRARALVEATIDFAHEEVPVDVSGEVRDLLLGLEAELASEIAGASSAERVRNGFEVAIVGRPNSGKSTLINKLSGRDAAITSSVAGTTRDVIEVRFDIAGLPVIILDTAGIRESDDPVERLGVERAVGRAEGADLRVILVEEGDEPIVEPRDGDIVLRAKLDREKAGVAGISGLTGHGIDELVAAIGEELSCRLVPSAVSIRDRHRQAIQSALERISRVRNDLSQLSVSPETIAEDLRAAGRDLDSLIGRIDVEHLLGDIFTSFCIGK